MARTFYGGATATKAGGTSGNSTISLTALTGGISSAAQAGDLVIAVYATGSTADRTLAITGGSLNYTLVGPNCTQTEQPTTPISASPTSS